MRPDEFATWAYDAKARLGLYLLAERTIGHPVEELATPGQFRHVTPERLFFTAEPPNAQALATGSRMPARWGWVLTDVPIAEGKTLYLGSLATRTDWQGDDGRWHTNPIAGLLFRRLKRDLMRHLSHPMWARAAANGVTQRYKTIGYSAGAADWVAHGGVCRQRGVAHVSFAPSEPAFGET